MTERGILFSSAMVRALLDGSKTQTRRALRVQPLDVLPMNGDLTGREWVGLMTREPKPEGQVFRCKFGVPGDRLWVRETWAQPTTLDPGPTFYRADYPACAAGFSNLPPADEITWKPSIHMFRKDSRILLEITGVRVERLQDISEADAAAEGWPRRPEVSDDPQVHADAARDWYMDLWEQINGAGSWAANPWVWVIEFRRVEG
jgi:hypothetical protein